MPCKLNISSPGPFSAIPQKFRRSKGRCHLLDQRTQDVIDAPTKCLAAAATNGLDKSDERPRNSTNVVGSNGTKNGKAFTSCNKVTPIKLRKVPSELQVSPVAYAVVSHKSTDSAASHTTIKTTSTLTPTSGCVVPDTKPPSVPTKEISRHLPCNGCSSDDSDNDSFDSMVTRIHNPVNRQTIGWL